MIKEDREILIESMRSERNPNPNPPEHAVRLLEETCARTGLDWKQRHVYLIQRGGKWQVTVSIDGFRLVANQDSEYGGQEGPFWTLGPDKPWTDIPPETKAYAAKVGVVRRNGATTWGVAKFDDYNAGSPLWKKMGPTMIAKCAEMLALRKALPGKLGGLYGVEEMDQADKPAKSERKSTTEQKVDGFDSPEGQTNSWEAKIQACKTLEELKTLGAEIQGMHMGREEKLALSIPYNNRKKELSA
jgi:hypothetical protein